MKPTLRICHLYPDLMDTYGDMGNITTLVKRCQWRNIEVTVSKISIGDKLEAGKFDVFFFGGGQDKQQELVAKDLKSKAKSLKTDIENGVVMLSICGGYQLLQNYFKTLKGKVIPGIGLFDAHTIGSTSRMIQNLLIELNPEIKSQIALTYQSTINNQQEKFFSEKSPINLIGFENHSGKTFLSPNLQPLGTVIKGAGNNGEDKTEGAVYKNAFGCYLHGSLLPKNPHFADLLIAKALEQQSGIVKLKPLNDSIEWEAHKQTIKHT